MYCPQQTRLHQWPSSISEHTPIQQDLLRGSETHRLTFSRGSYPCTFLHQAAPPVKPGQRSSQVPQSPLQHPGEAAGKKPRLRWSEVSPQGLRLRDGEQKLLLLPPESCFSAEAAF